jgi:hypothetical protein
MLDKADCFDADLAEKGDWVARVDVEECGDDAQDTFAQIFVMQSMLVILPRPSIVVFSALRWASIKSNSCSFFATCLASRDASTLAELLCPTKLRMVIELVSKFRELRFVL